MIDKCDRARNIYEMFFVLPLPLREKFNRTHQINEQPVFHLPVMEKCNRTLNIWSLPVFPFPGLDNAPSGCRRVGFPTRQGGKTHPPEGRISQPIGWENGPEGRISHPTGWKWPDFLPDGVDG